MDLNNLKNLDLNDLDFNNMGSWPLVAKIFVAAIVFGVVAFAGYKLAISEQQQVLVDQVRKEGELKKEFERKYAKAANLEDYKRQMVTIQDSFQNLLQQLPKSSELASLLEDITYAATGAGCEIETLTFSDEKKLEFYSEKAISIGVKGGYHQIAQFVSRVSRLPRIVTFHDFEIMLTEGRVPSAPDENLLILNGQAKTYRSDSEEQ